MKDNYKWRIRVTKVEGLDYFTIKTFSNHHKYSSIRDIHSKHCQVSNKLIDNHIKSKYIAC